MREIALPATGMAMSDGVLLKWLKQPGEAVSIGDVVVEVETDKATAELEAPVAGRLGQHLFAEGDTVPAGAAVTNVIEEGDADEAPRGGAAPSASTATQSRPGQVAAIPGAQVVVLTDRPTVTVVDAPARDAALPKWSERTPGRQRRAPRYESVGAGLGDPSVNEELLPLDLDGIDPADVREWLEQMVLIRAFETGAEHAALQGKIPGGMHSAAGQEAVAVGCISALLATDVVTSSHRSHHHSLAKGIAPDRVMAELYGKEGGCLGGRAGHMHLADFSIGMFGSNGVVGGGLGIATGAALGASLRDLDQVAVGFFGDGGTNTGRVWENLNLAVVWNLPLIAICENNLYAVETHADRMIGGGSIAERATGFGLNVVRVDGQDVAAVHRVVRQARSRAVGGGGPTFVEAVTYRYDGHNVGEHQNYREATEVELWRRTRDPIARAALTLESAEVLAAGELDRLTQAATDAVAAATAFAESSPWPDPDSATSGVTSLRLSMQGNL